MNYRKLLLYFFVVLSAVLCIRVQYRNLRDDRLQVRRLQVLREEARPHTDQIFSLQQSVQSKAWHVNDIEKKASILMSFLPAEASDILVMESIMESYEYEPTVVIDCSLTEEEIDEQLEVLRERDYEIVLSGLFVNDEVLDQVLRTRQKLEDLGLRSTNTFLLRDEFDSPKRREWFGEHKFRGLYLFSESFTNGLVTEELPFTAYGFIRNYDSGEALIKQIAGGRSSVIAVVDCNNIADQTLTLNQTKILLDLTQKQVEKDLLQYRGAEEMMQALYSGADLAAIRLQEYYDFAKRKQKEIDRIYLVVDGIYEDWSVDHYKYIDVTRTKYAAFVDWYREKLLPYKPVIFEEEPGHLINEEKQKDSDDFYGF